MKKKLHPTSQFKKDFKRIQLFPEKVEAFRYIADMLIQNASIPKEFKPHMLSGDYKGCMECYVENDLLLIWIDGDIIDLVRIGSHSELFGKKKKR